MSMQDYGVNDYGLLVDYETLKLMTEAKLGDDFDPDDFWGGEVSYATDFYEDGILEYIGDFTGQSCRIDDDGRDAWGGEVENYREEWMTYIPCDRQSTLFERAYRNVDEIIEEMKQKVGELLPDDYDYRKNIVHVVGTYFG